MAASQFEPAHAVQDPSHDVHASKWYQSTKWIGPLHPFRWLHKEWPTAVWPPLPSGTAFSGYLQQRVSSTSRSAFRGSRVSYEWHRRFVVVSGTFLVVFASHTCRPEEVIQAVSLWGPGLRQAVCQSEDDPAEPERNFVWALLSGPDISSRPQQASAQQQLDETSATWHGAGAGAGAGKEQASPVRTSPPGRPAPFLRGRSMTEGSLMGSPGGSASDVGAAIAAKAAAARAARLASSGSASPVHTSRKRAGTLTGRLSRADSNLSTDCWGGILATPQREPTALLFQASDAFDLREWVATVNAQVHAARITPVTVHTSTCPHIASMVLEGAAPPVLAMATSDLRLPPPATTALAALLSVPDAASIEPVPDSGEPAPEFQGSNPLSQAVSGKARRPSLMLSLLRASDPESGGSTSSPSPSPVLDRSSAFRQVAAQAAARSLPFLYPADSDASAPAPASPSPQQGSPRSARLLRASSFGSESVLPPLAPSLTPWGCSMQPLVGIQRRQTLGSGAFGSVVMGTAPGSGDPVAIKVTEKPPADDSKRWKVLLGEATAFERMRLAALSMSHPLVFGAPASRTVALTQHPNLVPLYTPKPGSSSQLASGAGRGWAAFSPAKGRPAPGLAPPLMLPAGGGDAWDARNCLYSHSAALPHYGIAEDDEFVYYTMPTVEGKDLVALLTSPADRAEHLGPVYEEAARIAPPVRSHAQPVAGSPVRGPMPSPGQGAPFALTPAMGDGTGLGLPLAIVRILVRDVARALASLHRMGIVHRDVKPDNVHAVPAAASAGLLTASASQDASNGALRKTLRLGALAGGKGKQGPSDERGSRQPLCPPVDAAGQPVPPSSRLRAVLLDYGFSRVWRLGTDLTLLQRHGPDLSQQTSKQPELEHQRGLAASDRAISRGTRQVLSWGSALASYAHPSFTSPGIVATTSQQTSGAALAPSSQTSFPNIQDDPWRMSTLFGTKYAAAPEIWSKTQYTRAVDSWGLGIITHMLLFASQPFKEFGGAAEHKGRIMRGEFLRPEPAWSALPQSARDLLEGLLQPDPVKRLAVEMVEFHPFVQELEADEAAIMAAAVGSVSEQRAGSASTVGTHSSLSAARELSPPASPAPKALLVAITGGGVSDVPKPYRGSVTPTSLAEAARGPRHFRFSAPAASRGEKGSESSPVQDVRAAAARAPPPPPKRPPTAPPH